MFTAIIEAILQRGQGTITSEFADGTSFRPCTCCLLSRPCAQFDGPDADRCQFCQQPHRYPLSFPLTAWETRNHTNTREEYRP
jgi:hypothetical protein